MEHRTEAIEMYRKTSTEEATSSTCPHLNKSGCSCCAARCLFPFLGAIGRHADNKLVLADNMPSRFHCVIESRAGGWIVRDLNSSNSTLMQGKRIATNPIQPGHLMMIGSTKLVIIDPSRKSPSEKDVVETDSERIAFQSDEPP